jgi:putative Mn2+ efflux pump MntP
MTTAAMLTIAFSLSMDAFAVSVSSGCSTKRLDHRHLIVMPLLFGLFQALMPVLGWFFGGIFVDHLVAWDHWIAFGLLAAVGLKMIVDAAKSIKMNGCEDLDYQTMPLGRLLALAVGTSIDAFAVGLSFSIVDVPIFTPVVIIGLVTFLFCIIGVVAGRILQHVLRGYAEIAGGLVLIALGTKIVIEHLSVA